MPETRTRDYRRHGTTCLLAALDVATGKVVGRTVERHRSAEFPRLPRPRRGKGCGGDRARNPGARHPRQRVVAPLGRGSRVAEGPSRLDVPLHADLGVPDGAVMNAVEGFFSKLARQRLKNAVFDSLDACVAAIGGLHRAPQRQGRAAVPVEPQPGGSCGVLEAGSPEAAGNGIK